ncbi:MAG: hypothetical protein NC483_01785 [Ruminococcus sp.]|nr:hypothetical protein [Ruminococcus sp.]
MNFCKIEEKNNFIDYKKCMKVIECLNNYFKDKNKIADIEYPSNILYKTKEYYLYMFYSCLLDYGIRSKVYHKNLVNTYKIYPNIFVPRCVLEMNENILKDIIINNIHPRYPNVAVRKWIILSKKLIEYDSILNYLRSINSFEELNSFIRSLKSYGQKTGGLLTRIICDTQICNFKENIESIPIDRHDVEISYLTSIINDKKINNKNVKNLSDAYVKCGKEMNINPSDVDKYLWEVGNSFCNNKKCYECPLKKLCTKECVK